MKRRAVLLDEHPLWLEAVEAVLTRADVAVAGAATDPERALALLQEHEPELYVTEIDTPHAQGDGLENVLHVRRQYPNMRVIVLTHRDDAATIHQALAAGVTAYVVKTAHPDDLAGTVRQAFSNSIFVAGSLPQAATPPLDPDTVPLTRRETEILRLVAEGRSNADLARSLWVTEPTVKFHLSNIYRKLGVSNRTEASRWAQVHGLLAAGGNEAPSGDTNGGERRRPQIAVRAR